MEHPARREHYRINYPAAARPRLRFGEADLAVGDLSEGGLRYLLEGQPAPAVGGLIEGTLIFQRGESEPVRGRVLRVVDRQVALQLDPPLPFRTIVEEQRYLRANHDKLGW